MDVSIIIPTYNRPVLIKRCLESLLIQETDKEWEIIVVDDGSEVDLSPIIESLNKSGKIKYYRQENSGPASARNKGAKMAIGKYIAFTDDDCTPVNTWISTLLKNAQENIILGGKTINNYKNNIYSETSQILIEFLYETLKGTTFYFFTTNNFLIPKKVFLDAKGFDESFPTSAGEDMEFCVRCGNLGYELRYVEDANVLHYHELSLSKFWKLHYKYGKASVIFRKKLSEISITEIRNPFHFHRKLIKYPFQIKSLSFFNKVIVTKLLVLSQFAHRMGFMSNISQIKK